jgi:protein SCO1/2
VSRRLLLALALNGFVAAASAQAPAPGSASAPTAAAEAAPAGTQPPPELEGVEIQDRSGTRLPSDLVLTDETGAVVRLGDYFAAGRPVLLQLVYFECPMLCNLALNGFLDGLKGLDWVPGREVEALTVSFDPRDTPAVAAAKKANYVTALGKPGAEAGWHFLTGSEAEVRRLAEAVGFRYRWVAEQNEFAHAAGLFVVTPDGTLSRTLYGIEYPPRELRLSLVEAGKGKLGTPLDRLILYCFRYDPQTHRYAMIAMNVMKLAGLATVLALGTVLVVFWSREHRRPHPA